MVGIGGTNRNLPSGDADRTKDLINQGIRNLAEVPHPNSRELKSHKTWLLSARAGSIGKAPQKELEYLNHTLGDRKGSPASDLRAYTPLPPLEPLSNILFSGLPYREYIWDKRPWAPKEMKLRESEYNRETIAFCVRMASIVAALLIIFWGLSRVRQSGSIDERMWAVAGPVVGCTACIILFSKPNTERFEIYVVIATLLSALLAMPSVNSGPDSS
ncbi:hypothetical protein P152DRAFT_71089 [Eremomyces bilateralis CBS 781.70]|uniref:Uncharacterized protein n=1 Tax=Eremomyces bilateralis CBS 781.70 TaxID=1392243 RepID=A0A6G1G0M9_9PEZI|nr:uncharacterized protein P152DRAFT_71089 [Eremomyces bilateralis CBS 781.70]KAF1811369.1 hypothetical protein P152DRAFT_71089 [Eremomyces bilateralis CBS 781.70]